MSDIIIRAGSFIAIVFLGYFLRRIGFFKKEDFGVISKIVIRITLPAALVVSFSGQELQYSMFLLSLLSLSFALTMIALAYLLNRGYGREAQAFAIINMSGFNIGNFVLPFAQSFLGPVAVMAVSIFDVGSSSIGLGVSYGIACMVKESGRKFSFRPILRSLFHSVPFITLMFMLILSLLHLKLPKPVIEFAGIISGGNAFLSMLLVGVGFELSGDRTQLGTIMRILLPKYLLGLAMSIVSYNFLPLPLEYRQALAILFFAPIPTAAPAFTADMGGDYGLASAVNSMAILVSIVSIVITMLIIL